MLGGKYYMYVNNFSHNVLALVATNIQRKAVDLSLGYNKVSTNVIQISIKPQFCKVSQIIAVENWLSMKNFDWQKL